MDRRTLVRRLLGGVLSVPLLGGKMSTSDAPDWSNSALITGSLPASGPAVTTVPVTIAQNVAFFQDTGTQFVEGNDNIGLGPGASASYTPPTLGSNQVYALDWITFVLPATSVASDLEAYLLLGSLKMVDLFSVTGGKTVLQQLLGGIPVPSGVTLQADIHNASGTNTYTGCGVVFIGRVIST